MLHVLNMLSMYNMFMNVPNLQYSNISPYYTHTQTHTEWQDQYLGFNFTRTFLSQTNQVKEQDFICSVWVLLLYKTA